MHSCSFQESMMFQRDLGKGQQDKPRRRMWLMFCKCRTIFHKIKSYCIVEIAREFQYMSMDVVESTHRKEQTGIGYETCKMPVKRVNSGYLRDTSELNVLNLIEEHQFGTFCRLIQLCLLGNSWASGILFYPRSSFAVREILYALLIYLFGKFLDLLMLT